MEEKGQGCNNTPKSILEFNVSTLMLFRCMRRDRAELLRHGIIYFGSPRQWIELELGGKKGQGDLLEGTFFSSRVTDDLDLIKRFKSDTALESFDHKGITFFRRKSVVDLRCLCLYGLQSNAFQKEISSDGRAHYNSRISKKYFSDFTDFKTRDDYEKADPQFQSVVVFINNPYKFFSKIRMFLRSLDVKDEEIVISPVKYLDRYSHPMLAPVPPPRELLLKDKAFQEQSEIRIIINSTSSKYLKYMSEHNNTIDVGSLEDITEIYNYYFSDMSLERIGSKGLMFSLPKSKEFHIQDMSYFDLESLLFNILRGTVKLKGVSEEDTWEKKLKSLSDLFLSKFGVILHVDEDKNVYLHNLSQDLLDQSHERYKHLEEQKQFEKHIEEMIKEQKTVEACDECLVACKNKLLFGAPYYYLGKLYILQCRYQEAIDAFFKSFDNDYKRIESLDGIASVYFRCKDYAKAIELYNAVQDEKGYDSMIWSNIGICYIHLGEYEKAIEFFDKGINANPNDAFLYYNRGVALYKLRQYAEAKKNMEKAMELDPQNATYMQNYSRCSFDRQE